MDERELADTVRTICRDEISDELDRELDKIPPLCEEFDHFLQRKLGVTYEVLLDEWLDKKTEDRLQKFYKNAMSY